MDGATTGKSSPSSAGCRAQIAGCRPATPSLRPEEMDAGVLNRIEAGTAADINAVIAWTPFDVSGVAHLLASLEIPGGPDLAEELHTYAGGNPMFVLETLRAMYSAGGRGSHGGARTPPMAQRRRHGSRGGRA